METKNYRDDEITDYLLGALPEAEMEAFDELSFLDDDFNERLSVVEKDLIDAYLENKLTGEKLEKFESYFLATPMRRQKIEFARALQFYAKNEKNKETVSKAGFFSLLINFLSGNKMQFGFAAAALLLLSLGGFWIINNRREKTEIAAHKTPVPPTEIAANSNQMPSAAGDNINTSLTPKPSPNATATVKATPTRTPTPVPNPSANPTVAKPVIATFFLTPALRGNNQVQTFSLSKQTTAVSVQLQLESDDYPAYQVSLVDGTGKTLRQSGKMKAGRRGANSVLTLSFPVRLINDGFYTISVSGIKTDGTAEIFSDYPFRAVLK